MRYDGPAGGTARLQAADRGADGVPAAAARGAPPMVLTEQRPRLASPPSILARDDVVGQTEQRRRLLAVRLERRLRLRHELGGNLQCAKSANARRVISARSRRDHGRDPGGPRASGRGRATWGTWSCRRRGPSPPSCRAPLCSPSHLGCRRPPAQHVSGEAPAASGASTWRARATHLEGEADLVRVRLTPLHVGF